MSCAPFTRLVSIFALEMHTPCISAMPSRLIVFHSDERLSHCNRYSAHPFLVILHRHLPSPGYMRYDGCVVQRLDSEKHNIKGKSDAQRAREERTSNNQQVRGKNDPTIIRKGPTVTRSRGKRYRQSCRKSAWPCLGKDNPESIVAALAYRPFSYSQPEPQRLRLLSKHPPVFSRKTLPLISLPSAVSSGFVFNVSPLWSNQVKSRMLEGRSPPLNFHMPKTGVVSGREGTSDLIGIGQTCPTPDSLCLE
jgi:hypothetical protein